MDPSAPASRRNLVIVGSVLLLHGLALWALQSGLLQRVVELVVPVEVVSDVVELPLPKTEPLRPVVKAPQPVPPAATRSAVAAPPAPMPVAIADATPAANAPTGVSTLQPAPSPIGTPVAAPVVVAAPAQGKVELPSSDADYLQNPRPAYPALSKRRGEQGRVVLRVLIGVDGGAQKAEIRQSSGFDRLDQAALATVLRWRYVPGKRGGVAEAMWFDVPIIFNLE